ncbi:MAG: hypothetical protein E7473_03005 [Ruminococcaceae bacterium]|nr:hypothetical protein [Oscillospiraceae bacterium]
MKLYINGEFHAMDIARNVFSALLEDKGAIVEVGKSKELLEKYPDVEIVDLGGKCVIPGIIDSHAHVFTSAYSEKTRELFIPKSVKELLENLRARVKDLKPGEWVVYKNTYPLRLSELRYPTKEELDEAAPNNPVSVDGYYSTQLNTAAINAIDFNALPESASIEYAEDGSLTGLFKCANPYITSFVDFGDGSEKEAVKKLMQEYNKCGITMAVEAMSAIPYIKLMKEIYDEGNQTIRIRHTMLAFENVAKEATEMDLGDKEISRVCFLKNLLDGGFLTGTAYMEYPYKNEGLKNVFGIDTHGEDDFGIVQCDTDALCESIRLARKYGLQYGAHCVGSGASKKLLDAYKIVNEEKNIKGERHALIHADFMDGNAIADANEMGISLLFQPAWHYMDAPNLDAVLDPRDAERFMKYTTILTADLAAAGSDHMVKMDPNESVNPYNPFTGMYNMITCKARDGKVYGKGAEVGREHALIAYTRDAARVCFDEELVGTLEVGKRADFAVLDNNYFTCDEEEIPEIRSVMTILDGKRVW